MGDDKVDVGIIREHPVPQEAQDGAVDIVVELGHGGADARRIDAAERTGVRVQEHGRLAAVELFKDGPLGGITGPHRGGAAVHRDAVCVQCIESVLDLLQTAIRIRQGHGREKPETTGMILRERCSKLVRLPCQRTRFWRAVVQRLGERHARENRRCDVVPVHGFERDLGRPRPGHTPLERRHVMMVYVYTTGMIERRLRKQAACGP